MSIETYCSCGKPENKCRVRKFTCDVCKAEHVSEKTNVPEFGGVLEAGSAYGNCRLDLCRACVDHLLMRASTVMTAEQIKAKAFGVES